MQVAVISDTHRHMYSINQAEKLINDADVIIHLGDNEEDADILEKNFKGKVISVRGNCDFSSFAPIERLEEFGGKRIFITHGHKYDVKYSLLKLKYRAKEVEADIVLYGHTHQKNEIYEEGIWFINPGSASLPRDSSKSIAIIELEEGNIKVNFRNIK